MTLQLVNFLDNLIFFFSVYMFAGPQQALAVTFIQKEVQYFLYIFFGGLECVGLSFACVAYFVFLGDVWIRTQTAAVASRRATNLPPLSLF
jgi:hypothetical protein